MRMAVIRWCLGLACLIACALLMRQAFKMASLAAAPCVIGSLLALVSFVVMTAEETAVRVAEWCARPLTQIFFPSEELARPPLTYRLARHYSGSLRLRDAVEQYRNIIHFYPDQRQAYEELIEVAARLGDDELRQQYEAAYRRQFLVEPAAVTSAEG